jgi:hypothetical protein
VTRDKLLYFPSKGRHAEDFWRGMYRVLVGKREVKRPLGRLRWRWDDNIKMDLREAGCRVMD